MPGRPPEKRPLPRVETADLAKLIVTAFFLPLIGFIVIYGSLKNDGSMVGIGLALVGVVGALWGTPQRKDSGGGDA